MLSLRGSSVDDNCVGSLLNMSHLKYIQANGLRKLSASAIRRLKQHPTLEKIDLTTYCIPAEQHKSLVEDMKPIKVTFYGN